LSKGLGAPVGSLLIGNKQFINEARRIRKVMGGGMRQAGFLAAAGVYALDNHVNRLKTDHINAKEIAVCLEKLEFVKSVKPVKTNIIIFDLQDAWTANQLLEKLAENGVKASAFGPKTVRFVTHLDVSDEMIHEVKRILENISAD
jgi:threonine aldolase